MSYPGCFITLEGIEGCGKSTQAAKLADYLKELGYQVILTKEPGATALGTPLRKLLLNPQRITIGAKAELFLFAADRSQHVEELILPAIKEGKIVVCDRYTDATMAYQGYARGLDKALIQDLNELAALGLSPQLTILLDLTVSEGLSRALDRNQRNDSASREDRFEQEGKSFHEKVRYGYLELARAEPDRIKIIDADSSIEEIHNNIVKTVAPLLKGWEKK